MRTCIALPNSRVLHYRGRNSCNTGNACNSTQPSLLANKPHLIAVTGVTPVTAGTTKSRQMLFKRFKGTFGVFV